MSSTKTTTLTVAAVIALAAIPFARQRIEAGKIQEQLTRYDSPFSNSRAAGTESCPSRSASGDGRSASARPASTPRTILLDLCSSDPVASGAARDRVALMSDEERAGLLAELWRFPCTNSSRHGLVNFLMQSNAGNLPDKVDRQAGAVPVARRHHRPVGDQGPQPGTGIGGGLGTGNPGPSAEGAHPAGAAQNGAMTDRKPDALTAWCRYPG